MNYFCQLKTLPRSLTSCGCETFRVLKYFLSIFLHYTHPCRMILHVSEKKYCLLLNGVSTESKKRTSVIQIRRDYSPTRNMTRINVGLVQITSKLLTHCYRYHKLRKTFGKFFRSYSKLLSKFGAISFQDYVSQGITHPVYYGDLVYKLRRVKGEANFITSGLKIVKRLRRLQYDPAIIKRTIDLVLGPFYSLVQIISKAFHSA